MVPRIFTSLTTFILFHCQHNGLHVVIYLDDILVLTQSKHADKTAQTFLCLLLVFLELHINFSKSELCLMQQFSFLRLCWDTVDMSVSPPSDKLIEIQWLVHDFYRDNPLQSIRLCPFWARPPFMQMIPHNFAGSATSFRVTS